MWIGRAGGPLQVNKLCHALAVRLGSTDFHVGYVPSISAQVNRCQEFTLVDKEGYAVGPVHFILQEYLSARPDTDIFSRPRSAKEKTCLSYPSSQQVKAPLAVPSPNT